MATAHTHTWIDQITTALVEVVLDIVKEGNSNIEVSCRHLTPG